RSFADAVFEMSNGAHKLRNVRIVFDPALRSQANVHWVEHCWPNAHISGYGVSGLRILMCDKFTDNNGVVVFDYLNASDGPEQGGYTLAHELGHYYYSLYDEYWHERACNPLRPGSPCRDDIPVSPSIMTSPWWAHGGYYEWLNFSTSLNNTRRTAQHRVYRASGWETLARSPDADPRDGVLSSYPRRLYHPELMSVAPPAGQAPRIDLTAGHQARSLLRITWNANTASLASAPDVIASLHALNVSAVMYPEPIRLLAVLQRTHPIARATVDGVVQTPDGQRLPVTLRDDGVAPDLAAEDGVYAGMFLPVANGEHRIEVVFSNPNGAAVETSDSGAPAPPPPGTTPAPPSPHPLTMPFTATAQLVVAVTGVQSDDHGDAAARATDLPASNRDAWGRIERAGDRDWFRITAPGPMYLVVRTTSLAQGMQTCLRLLDADGTTELVQVHGNGQTAAPYPHLIYYLNTGRTVYAEVRHCDPTASGGVYQVSAGAAISSDQIQMVHLPMVIR
ncbi:MAG: choice-of-anchor X domain-containing protein, partial [Roseiflexaceae bacterium]|nr:choice-of-anchor X domain-containing protein [Roseiflexaceae bacterium]